MRKIIFIILLALIFIGAGYLFAIVVPNVDRDRNAVTPHDPYTVTGDVQAFHDGLFIADLHSDMLLWRRNPKKRHDRGHTDLPRLREGGVNLQVFSAVTKSPSGLNFDGNDASAPDDITKLALVQLWPPSTWNSIYERAVFQARRLQKIEHEEAHHLTIIRRANDLTQTDERLMGLLTIEGAHPLEGKIENIKRLHNEGYRMMGLQHFFDNELGGSLHGRTKSGLTDFGREAVLEMERLEIIIDVAHSSVAVVRDVLKITHRPVLISHGGVRSACPLTANRNLPDELLKDIISRGGLIGIGYFDGVICDITPKGIASSLMSAVALLGEDGVALGSDFDGTVTTSLDTSELSAITQALIDLDMDKAVIKKIMGENIRRFLEENLPKGQ